MRVGLRVRIRVRVEVRKYHCKEKDGNDYLTRPAGLLRRAAADLEGFAHSAAAEGVGAVRKADAVRVHVYGPRSERECAM